MNNKIKPKKYFLKDSELKSIEEDRLNQKDIVKNLHLIIDNTKPPYNIALLGKWGIGKSSIINLLLNKYKNDPENYNIEEINVWKENASLKNVLDSKFNKITNEDIQINTTKNSINNEQINEESNKQNINTENSSEAKTTEKSSNKPFNLLISVCNTIIIFMASLFITSIIFVLIEYFQNMSIYNANHVFFVENTYLNYCENLGAILIFSIILTIAGLLLSKVGSKNSKTKSENSFGDKYETVNGITYEKKNGKTAKNANINVFETNYKSSYENKSVKNNIQRVDNSDLDRLNDELYAELYAQQENDDMNFKDKKNIIIIEDIDKLSASKMLATLEEIKHCNQYENCICIVPFDASVLKKAIEARNTLKLNKNYKPVNMELILDKIFQFKVHIPHICNKSVKDFAVDLAQENIPNFIAEYCPIDVFEKVVRYVLIYKNVTTPRHVKKLINNFVNNRILTSYRIQDGKIDEEFVNTKEFEFALAKISVIQSDFYGFYNVLFKDSNYLNELTELYCLEPEELKEKFAEIDENLKPFFTAKYKPLRNFLKQTKRFEIEDVETLIYLTKIETEKMFGDKSVFSYIKGDEDIFELSLNDILKLVQLIDKKDDLKEFTANNFAKILEIYNNNAEDLECFVIVNEIVNNLYEFVDEDDYLSYLEIAANNYNSYPSEALQLFKNVEIEIPGSIMVVLFEKLKDNLSVETYDDSFKILRENSESFYEENGNVSDYVQFLVNYIGLSSNPNEVIEELDENFTRIGRIYELNRNVKGLLGLDLDKAYSFMAKCLDNGDLDRMVLVINSILSDEDVPVLVNAENDVDDISADEIGKVSNKSENALINDCLNIEDRMDNYNLIDVIEYNVDSMSPEVEEETAESAEELDGDAQINNSAGATTEVSESSDELNYTLLKNLIEISAIKQTELNPVDVMKLIEKALSNITETEYLYNVYSLLKKFNRMYFYEIRRDFNEVIYESFHTAKKNLIKEEALECARYFKTTRLFKTKLTAGEEKFYNEN